MAKYNATLKMVTVEAGDTLSQIAVDYAGGYSKYKTLAAINNIKNTDYITVGQTIKLVADSSTTTTSTTVNAGKPTLIESQCGELANDPGTLYATWSWGKLSTTESFVAQWTYQTSEGIDMLGEAQNITVDEDDPELSCVDTFAIPSGAVKVEFKVKPISKTKDGKTDGDVYWTADWSTVWTWTNDTTLTAPSSAPSVEIEKFTLTASVENVKIKRATHIQFQVVKDNEDVPFATELGEIVSNQASHSFSINVGSQYKARCRAYNTDTNEKSEWTDYSSNYGTIPSTPESITELKALSSASIQVTWATVSNATSYTVEYTTNEIYFDTSSEVQSLTVTNTTGVAIVTGITIGKEYFFRVKASNDQGDSGWTDSKSLVIGKAPSAPTTWSSTTTAIVGEAVNLYWVHNSSDGSDQTAATLELYIENSTTDGGSDGSASEPQLIDISEAIPDEDEDYTDGICKWVLATSSYSEGCRILWRISTRGVTNEDSDWSAQRVINVYAPATLQLSITDMNGSAMSILRSFPFKVNAFAGPKTQAPIGYHLSIKSSTSYKTTDNIGNTKNVNAGDEVYSKYFDENQDLSETLSASDVDLENNVTYTITCTSAMDSGLTAEASLPLTVAWDDELYVPNAEISIDTDKMTASIRPYCENIARVHYLVSKGSSDYTKTTTVLSHVWGERVKGAKTTTGELVYYGVSATEEDIYFCTVEETTPVTDVLLSVYRREFDGSFTELETNIDVTKSTTIVDPHPALDYARYRIVAMSTTTGAVSYYDPPGHYVGGTAVIIQWDEAWNSFETADDGVLAHPAWSGSMLKLPYNIDVSESNSSDKTLVEYAGRSHPVCYYGTQLGVAATWSVEVPKTDKETLYALRRLARWMGDVYVREPSGSGYWASIDVSFNQKHKDTTIPVSLSISQVEGGM